MKKMKKSLSLILAAFMSLQTLSLAACELPFGTEETKVETYEVSVTSSVGGSITADASEVEQGKDVTFTIPVNDGYILDSLIKVNQLQVCGFISGLGIISH